MYEDGGHHYVHAFPDIAPILFLPSFLPSFIHSFINRRWNSCNDFLRKYDKDFLPFHLRICVARNSIPNILLAFFSLLLSL